MKFTLLQNTITVVGTNSVAEYLRSEFSRMPQTTSSPDIIFEVKPGFTSPPANGVTTDGEVYVNDEIIFIDRRISVPIRNPKDLIHNYVGTLGRQINIEYKEHEIYVTIQFDPRIVNFNYLAQEGLRFLSRSYVYRSQNLAKVILYNDIEPLIHQIILEDDAAFVHASGILRPEGGIVFSGWGGAGKTSIATRLLEDDTGTILADDLCLVSANGTTQPYYKRVQLYPYNLEKSSNRRMMSGRSMPDRINWILRSTLLGEKAVRRRLLTDQIHSVTDEKYIDISKLVYLTRENCQEIDHNYDNIRNISTRAVATIAHEFDTHVHTLTALSAANPNKWPSLETFLLKTRDVYERAFDSADLILVRIPQETTPTELADYVKRNILQN